MLNLTPDPIVLIDDNGKTEIPASGYVARVEYERQTVAFEQAYFHDRDRFKYVEVPVIEETPKEIVLVRSSTQEPVSWSWANPRTTTSLYIVSREVAEAAARYRHFSQGTMWTHGEGVPYTQIGAHPLAARMVWAANPQYKPYDPHETPEETVFLGYRELRRVSGVAR